jgi:hypothetical protein
MHCEDASIIRGCRLQVAGCRLQVAGCRLQVAGCRLQVAGCMVMVYTVNSEMIYANNKKR